MLRTDLGRAASTRRVVLGRQRSTQSSASRPRHPRRVETPPAPASHPGTFGSPVGCPTPLSRIPFPSLLNARYFPRAGPGGGYVVKTIESNRRKAAACLALGLALVLFPGASSQG